MDFRGAFAKRLGGLSWFSFPGIDDNENNVISISFPQMVEIAAKPKEPVDQVRPPQRRVEIKFPHNESIKQEHVLVRCRVRYHFEVNEDIVKRIVLINDAFQTEFTLPPDCENVLITIWRGEGDEGPWQIWYENSFTLIREIVINLGVIGLSGVMKSEWLEKFSKSKHKEYAQEAEKLTQVEYQPVIVTGTKEHYAPSFAKEFTREVRALFPKPSKGIFIPKSLSENDPARIRFLNWFKNLTQTSEEGRIVIIDPYFDVLGVEFISRATGAQIEYLVLTNTQIDRKRAKGVIGHWIDWLFLRLKRKNSTGVPPLPNRRGRLLSACQRSDQLFSRLRFKLLDLRSVKGGSGQLFHDRYILYYSKDGTIKEGYNLSNSFQSATQRFPLLITPIPQDILEPVSQYVGHLLEAKSPTIDSAEILQLYPLAESQHSNLIEPDRTSFYDQPSISQILSVLFADNKLAALNSESLKESITKLTGNGDSNHFGNSCSYLVRVESLHDELMQCSDFDGLWDAFGDVLARLSEPERLLLKLADIREDALPEKLLSYLTSKIQKSDQPVMIDRRSEDWHLLGLLRMDFNQALNATRTLLEYGSYDYRSAAWGIKYAVKLLLQIEPEETIKILSRVRELIPDSDSDASTLSLTQVIVPIFQQLIEELSFSENMTLLEAMISCELLALKSLACQKIAKNYMSPEAFPDIQEAFNILNRLSAEEHLAALSEWVYSIRIISNRNRREDDFTKGLRKAIFDQLVKLWTHKMSKSNLDQLIKRLSGPGEGGWAISTTNDLLIPLCNSMKLSIEKVAAHWLSIVKEKLNSEQRIYYYPDDAELTEVCGWALSRVDANRRSSELDNLGSLLKHALRAVQRPFSKSANYSNWFNSVISLLWIKALLTTLKFYLLRDDVSSQSLNDSILNELLGAIDSKVQKIDIQHEFDEIIGLTKYIDDMNGRISGLPLSNMNTE